MNLRTNVPSRNSFESPSTPDAGEQRDDAALALGSSVTTGAQELAAQAKQGAGDVFDQAKKSAESRISGGKERAAESLSQVAEALRHTGERLQDQDASGLTDYVVRAADQVDAASRYLQRRSFGDVLDDVGGFARREPALFLGGAFALGLLGGRFLKSSRPQGPGAKQLAADAESGDSPRTSVSRAGPNRGQDRDARRGARGGKVRSQGDSAIQARPEVGGEANEPSSSVPASDGSRSNGGSAAKAPGAM